MNELEWGDWLIIIVGIVLVSTFLVVMFLLPQLNTPTFPVEPVKPHMNPLGIILNV